MLNFYDFIQVYVFTTNYHLKQRKGSLQPLLYSQLQERIKSLIFKTGRDPSLYSSHSFRRGGCTWAFKAGVPTGLIQHHGDWLSECYKRYLAFNFHEKLSVSGRMAAKVMEGDIFEPCSLPSDGQRVKPEP